MEWRAARMLHGFFRARFCPYCDRGRPYRGRLPRPEIANGDQSFVSKNQDYESCALTSELTQSVAVCGIRTRASLCGNDLLRQIPFAEHTSAIPSEQRVPPARMVVVAGNKKPLRLSRRRGPIESGSYGPLISRRGLRRSNRWSTASIG